MKKSVVRSATGLAAILAITTLSTAVKAEPSVTVSGFIRQEMAVKATNDENLWNQQGNKFNGKTVVNALGVPVTRNDVTEDNDWNLMATRAEVDFQIGINDNWKGFVKVRGFFDYDNYNDYGDPSLFEVPFFGDCGTRLEVCGDKYMIDLPSAYLDYNNGPLWLRIGNQQIAWGEAIFFRVADVANGLDLRRHSIFDLAYEEYADERVSSPGIRGSYRFNEEWELELFTQMFSPSIYSNENTPYNVRASQFVFHEKEGLNDVENDWNVGGRLKAQLGDLGLQFFAVSRRNPDGVYRWTESGVNPGGPAGDLLAQTPFEMNPQGVWSSNEWYDYAGASGLSGTNAFNSAVSDFGASQALGAFVANQENCDAIGISDVRTCAEVELDTFFGDLGPLRGHLSRRYRRETIIGSGFNYINYADPDSFFDQLVTRFEFSYTPDKIFTNPDLGADYLEEDEYAASLIFEKYHRFSRSFPATYMVLQYMFKSESDLYGRSLKGLDNGDGDPKGEDSFNAFAIAIQQPSPTLKWRYDLSVLYDVRGGVFAQPSVRWKPTSEVTVEAYANYFYSNGGNDDIIEPVDWGDEIGLRLGYQF